MEDCNNYTVYRHISPSGKQYVGITKQKPERRWRNGEDYSKQPFYNAIKKYGWNNIKHEIIVSGISENAAKKIERFYIAKYMLQNKNYGYNVSPGGDTCTISEAGRKKISETHKGKSRTSPWKGHSPSIETRKKMSEAHKTSAKCLAYIERRRSVKEAKIKESQKPPKKSYKAVVQYDTQGMLINIFDSYIKAAESIHINKHHVLNNLTKRTKTCHGYIFKYIDEPILNIDIYNATHRNISDEFRKAAADNLRKYCQNDSRKRKIKSIDQYGNIKFYDSIQQARDDGHIPEEISRCLSKKNSKKTHHELAWFYYDDEVTEEILLSKFSNKNIGRKPRRINQFSIEMQLLHTYDCIKDAQNDGYIASGIRKSISGERLTYKGYIWKYADF